MLLNVDVTQADIDGGVRNSCTQCPIATAARRATGVPRLNFVYVYRTGIDIWNGPRRSHQFILPSIALGFMARFDRGKPVEPFSFQVEERGAE